MKELLVQIFKLSQGEYVAVERIESAYKKLGLIAQIFVYGNSMESVLVAVVVPVRELPPMHFIRDLTIINP